MTVNKTLLNLLVETLKNKGLTMSTAESMTGGLVAKTITDIPGTSAIFDRGIVTYSNGSKISELDVDPDTIDTFGAISPETAREMVEGLRIHSMSDICISVTGNAGPFPAENKANGLYYIGFYYNGQTSVIEVHSTCKSRDSIRNDACNTMMQIIYDSIK